MQSFMPIDLRASQFVRGNANFLAKNATRDIGLDKEVSFRKYNADVKELDALAGSMDKLAAQLETHLGELGEVEDKLNGIRDIISTVKEADDLYAADPINNPALDQSVRDVYQRQINTLFSEIEDIVSTTKVFGKNVFDGYFNLGSIGDNKNESFGVNLSPGYISAANNSAYAAAGKVSSTGQFGRDFAMEGNYILISANNQNNIANGTTANAGQGAVMLYNKTNLTSPQTTIL